jgi:hypothetical protein
VEKVFGVGTITGSEQELLKVAFVELKKNIEKGVEFAKAKTANL